MPHLKITYERVKDGEPRTFEYHPADTHHTMGTEVTAHKVQPWLNAVENARKTGWPRWLRGAKAELVADESGPVVSIT